MVHIVFAIVIEFWGCKIRNICGIFSEKKLENKKNCVPLQSQINAGFV